MKNYKPRLIRRAVKQLFFNNLFFLLVSLFFYNTVNCPAEDLKISKPDYNINFYMPPYYVSGGYRYRYNDFSIFPNAGTSFDAKEKVTLDAFGALSLDYKNFSIEPSFHYQYWASPRNNDPVYYGKLSSTIRNSTGSVSFKAIYGKIAQIIAEESGGAEAESSPDTLIFGIAYNLFIINSGVLHSTALAEINLQYLPKDNFSSFNGTLNIPIVVSLYYVDLGFEFSSFYANKLDFAGLNGKTNYKTAKKYSYVTSRIGLPDDDPTRFECINTVEFEPRWYFLRPFVMNSPFFISLFANGGIGIESNSNYKLLWQAGGGIGAMLFDVVPFTFQAGVNEQYKPIIYVGVVSRIMNMP